MKCPYCGQEHPDNAKFCMETGQRLMPQNRACSNTECPDFGKYILPMEAKFCPRCGAKLESALNRGVRKPQCSNEPIGRSEQQRNIAQNSSKDVKLPPKLDFVVNDVHFNMILVEHGSFMMGATPEQEDSFECQDPVHRVVLSNDYYIGETPVTQALWRTIMKNNPSLHSKDENPVDHICWLDCHRFIRELQVQLRYRLDLLGLPWQFRLPTEAEWEFAGRGGNRSRGYQYSGSNDLDEVGWFNLNSSCRSHRVRCKKPNELGIYDMSGNVEELCLDTALRYKECEQIDPLFLLSSSETCVTRGGNNTDCAEFCSLSCRGLQSKDEADFEVGMRLVLSPIIPEPMKY